MISLSVNNVLSISDNSAQCNICSFNGKYLAFKLKTNKDIGIWFLKNQPVTLYAHHLPIQALSFCHPHQGELLCSCSDDNIILWDLSQYFRNEKVYRGHILYSGLSGISSCCFSFYDLNIAICSKRNIYVLDLKTKQFLITLNDTSFPIDCCFTYFNTLFSISEDGISKIWKMQKQGSAYHKCVTGALPVILTISYKHHRIAVGTASGNIEIYQTDIENNFQHLSSLKVWKLMYDVNKKRENFNINTQNIGESTHILEMKFITKSPDLDSERLWIESEPLYLIIVISTGIFIINTENENINYYNFTEFNSSNQDFILPSIIRSAHISCSNEEIIMILIPLLENEFYKLTVNIHFSKVCNKISMQMDNLNLEENITHLNNVDSISFISRESVPPESLLMKEMKTKKQIKLDKSSKMFQPLTFKSNIKSSGYNKSSRRELFHPMINKRNNNEDLLSKRKCNLTWENKEDIKYHWEKKPKLLSTEKLSENSQNLILQISGDDKIAALGYSDGLIQLLKIPQLKISSSLFYHNKNISNVHFSHSNMGELLLTSGYDKKVLIWKWKQYQKPLLILDSIKFERKSKKNMPLPEEITAAQFYYMDKFILLAYGNSLNMFLYNIDTSKSDIESYKMKSQYERVAAITLDSKRITALSAINQFYSNLALCGTSSNAINVFDMNTGQCIRCVTDVHNKPVYKIALNQGSPYVNQPSAMYDIYATVSLSDGIKLWDLRTTQCIRYLKEHPNRYYSCDISFSSCGQYLLSGAEDKCLYTYELRTSKIVQKITGFTDIVSNALFLTSKSKVLATTVDGKAYLYGYDILSQN